MKSWNTVSKCVDLSCNRRVCGVESACMSFMSGKLKSPSKNVVQIGDGGMCLRMVLSVV